MNNGYTNIKPEITVEKHNIYSASLAAALVVPVSDVQISDLPEGKFDLTVSMECVCGEKCVWKVAERTFFAIDKRLVNYGVYGKAAVNFSFDDFDINFSFLNNLTDTVSATVNITVSIDGAKFTASENVKIVAFSEWSGIECHPETLASFVTPESKRIAEITENIEKAKLFSSADNVLQSVSAVVDSIRGKNIVCAKKDSYSPEKRQEIKTADMLTDKSSVLATPTELAVMFCACAERLGLSPVIAFLKNHLGAVSIFCGINVYGSSGISVISESLSKARMALKNGALVMFDPATLSSAQTIEISHANAEASNHFHKSGTELLLLLAVKSARNAGIHPISGDVRAESLNAEPREALAKIYTGLVNRPVFKLLEGDYSAFDMIPLIGSKMPEPDENGWTAFKPLELNEKIHGFAGFCDNLASFTLAGVKPKNYNDKELALAVNACEAFRERVAAKEYAVCGMYENVFHEYASRMTFGYAEGMSSYLVCGFVRLTEAKSGETVYMPVCFRKLTLDNKFDYRFSYDNSRIIVNTVLLSYLSADDSVVLHSDNEEKIFEFICGSVAKAQEKLSDFSEIAFIREYALVKADLSEFVLWNDIRGSGKTMLGNKSFAAVVSENKEYAPQAEKHTDNFAFPLYTSTELSQAIKSGDNVVINGSSVREKTDACVNKIAINLFDGRKTLVSSGRKEFFDEILRGLSEIGIEECALTLSEVKSSAELVERIRVRLTEALTFNDNQFTNMATEFDKNAGRIDEFCKLISKPDDALGITVLDAVASYSNAVRLEGGELCTLLPVNDKLFSNISEQKFNMLFELAEKLIYSAIKAQRAVAVPESTPLKAHPLYPMSPDNAPTSEQINEAFDIISRIRPVLADYRDNFLDICDDMGMKLSDIKDLNGLLHLNELYRVIISARELDIPENFSKYDISGFADGAGRLRQAKMRIENIEYRLKFFGKELFEDVDTLLSGYNHTEGDRGSIIKKFLLRRNNKDVLLQYISAENRAEFARHDVGEIYELLDEYRAQKKILSGERTEFLDENGAKLAELAKEVGRLLTAIFPGLDEDSEKLNAMAGKIFEFIEKVTMDASISKNLTYSRARLAQVYSDNECLVSALSSLLGADFTLLRFDCGILDYDGFSEYLRSLEKNIPAMNEWITWLKAKKEVNVLMPSFAKHLEDNGITENTDRIFAASLIGPAVSYLFKKHGIQSEKERFDAAKIKYKATLVRARELAKVNTLAAFRQKLKHYAETVSLTTLDDDRTLPVTEFVNKYKDAIFGIYPVVLARKEDIGTLFGGECVADTLICDDTGLMDFGLLSAVSAAKNVFLVKYNGESGVIGKALERLQVKDVDISYHLYPASRKLCAYLGNGKFIGSFRENEEITIDTVNGFIRRSTDLAIPAEAELCVTKATELAQKGEKSIGIFASTNGQYAYIKHLLCLYAESDGSLERFLDDGIIKVYNGKVPCFDKVENVIVSLGAAVDKSGSIGWHFGYGERKDRFDVLSFIANAACGRIMFVSSLSLKDAAKIRNSSTEGEKLFGLLKFVQSGMLPLYTASAENVSSKGISFLLKEKCECVSAIGRYECGADAVDIERNIYYVADNGASESVYDKLAASTELAAAGLSVENVSVLDKIVTSQIS